MDTSISAGAQSEIFRRLIREHIEIQSESNIQIPLEERGRAISFYALSQSDKRELVAAALISEDLNSYELMMELEDQSRIVTQLIFQCSIGKIKPEDLKNYILDSILIEKSDLIEEEFEEEWEIYFNKQLEINSIDDFYIDMYLEKDIYQGVNYGI